MVTVLAVLGAVAVACGAAGEARDEAIAAATEGTWDCGSDGKAATDQIVVDDDGGFAFRSLEDPDDDDGDRQEGTWEVVDKEVRLSVGLADDKELLDVRGFDDLDVEAGTIEIQNPDDPDEQATFAIEVRSDDVIGITPKGDGADQFPTAPWTCERQ